MAAPGGGGGAARRERASDRRTWLGLGLGLGQRLGLGLAKPNQRASEGLTPEAVECSATKQTRSVRAVVMGSPRRTRLPSASLG